MNLLNIAVIPITKVENPPQQQGEPKSARNISICRSGGTSNLDYAQWPIFLQYYIGDRAERQPLNIHIRMSPKNIGEEAFFQEENERIQNDFRRKQEIQPKEWRDLIIMIGHPDDHY